MGSPKSIHYQLGSAYAFAAPLRLFGGLRSSVATESARTPPRTIISIIIDGNLDSPCADIG